MLDYSQVVQNAVSIGLGWLFPHIADVKPKRIRIRQSASDTCDQQVRHKAGKKAFKTNHDHICFFDGQDCFRSDCFRSDCFRSNSRIRGHQGQRTEAVRGIADPGLAD